MNGWQSDWLIDCLNDWHTDNLFLVFPFSVLTSSRIVVISLNKKIHRTSHFSLYSFFFPAVVNLGWFWGDPHFKTLDGGNYTFNGLGEYVMIDAQNGTFQLQARTSLAQGNSTTATIFAAGAAKEENTSTVEVRVKKGGEEGFGCSYTRIGKHPWDRYLTK